MPFRFNLNTVDYSHYGTPELLAKLNAFRVLSGHSNADYEDYDDKAEDVWSILYNRRKENPDAFLTGAGELFEIADRGQLSEEDLECLEEGFLP